MGAPQVVSDVLAETNGLDGVPCEVASADKAASQVDQGLGRPGALCVASVPESCEEPLENVLEFFIFRVLVELTSRVA